MLLLITCLAGLLVACYFLYNVRLWSGSFSTELGQTTSDGEAYCALADSDLTKYQRVYTSPGQQVLVLYGTEYGFAEEVARYVFDKLIEHNKVCRSAIDSKELQPRLINAKHYNCINWSCEQAVLVIVSTTGNGVPPTNAQAMFDYLAAQHPNAFSHISYSLLALGNMNYTHFCRAGIALDNILANLGAHCLVERCDIDGDDWAAISAWTEDAVRAVGLMDITVKQDYLQQVTKDDDCYGMNRPFMALLTHKHNLTGPSNGDHYSGDDKETLHADFDLTGSGLSYLPGDALGIYPTNNPNDVERVITAMHCHGNEPVPVPWSCWSPRPNSLTLREALIRCYNLKAVRPELLQHLTNSSCCGKTASNYFVALLGNGMSKQNTDLWSYLHKQEVADVLEACVCSPTVPIAILNCLRSLQPRYYSIASSPNWAGGFASVCATVLRYELSGIPRSGVATTFLQDRVSVGDRCPVFISRNPDFRLPEDKSKAIVMIGPGTGIAAFRAFIQERLLTGATGLNILYFGCQHRHQDYLYRSELEQWAADKHIVLRTAFSRDQAKKVYVQNLIAEDRDMLMRLLQDGCHVYVCGDARHMAGDVHSALQQVLQRQNMSPAEASEFLDELERTHRYQRDVWVT